VRDLVFGKGDSGWLLPKLASARQGALGGKKCSSSALLMPTRSPASRSEGNQGVFLGATSCLAVQVLLGEVLARKSAQYEALAFLRTLKWPSLHCLAVQEALGVRRFLAVLVAFANSWQRVGGGVSTRASILVRGGNGTPWPLLLC